MRRREFITLFGGAAAARLTHASSAHAAPSGPSIVGLLLPGSSAAYGNYAASFSEGLREGAGEPNVTLEIRFADGAAAKFAPLTQELVALGARVIGVGSTGAALAAMKVAPDTALVFASGYDPVGAGLVSSMSQPGGSATGVHMFNSAVLSKRLELLIELAPATKVVGVLINPSNPNGAREADDALAAGRASGLQVQIAKATKPSEIDTAMAEIVAAKAGALLVVSDPFLNSQAQSIVRLANAGGLIANYPLREFALAGGLTSYGFSFADTYRQMGVYAGRIVRGARPADLPIVQPTRFELAVNLLTAKALALTVPPSILARADEVIE